jgi:hypothetical protein
MLLSVLLILLAVGDISSTYVGIKTEIADEQNERVQFLFDNYGFISFAVIKMTAVGAVIGIFLYFYSKGLVVTSKLVLIELNGMLMLVLANNLIVISGKFEEIYNYSSGDFVFVILASLIAIAIFLSLIIDGIAGWRPPRHMTSK